MTLHQANDQYRIVRIKDSFYIQEWCRRWFQWSWRNVEYYSGLTGSYDDYFPSFEDAKEYLDDMLEPRTVKVLYQVASQKGEKQ